MAGCLWLIKWKGIMRGGNLIAGVGGITFRAPNLDWAIEQLTGALAKVFGGDCRFFQGWLYIRKIQDNPPIPIGEEPIENVLPKISKWRRLDQQKQKASG